MQTSPLLQFLLLMENLYVVAALTLVAVILRVFWVGYRKRRPLTVKPGQKIPPHDGMLEALEVAMFIPAVGLWLAVIQSIGPIPSTIAAIAGYFVLVTLIRMMWKKYRAAHPLPPVSAQHPASPKDMVLEIIDTVIIALVLVFGIVRPFMMQTYFIPSGSMEPTLLGPAYHPITKKMTRGGDKLIANKFVLRFRMPNRGEIVVFEPPAAGYIGNNYGLKLCEWLDRHPDSLTLEETQLLLLTLQDPRLIENPEMGFSGLNRALRQEPSNDAGVNVARIKQLLPKLPAQRDAFIKRVVGLPNDQLEFRSNAGLYLNGELLEEPYLTSAALASSTLPFVTPPGEMPRLKTTQDMNGNNTSGDEFFGLFIEWISNWYMHDEVYLKLVAPHMKDGKFVVPADSVFVAGDNRGHSFDSRWWGVVPRENIKARAVSTFWPLNRLKLL
jgi:signal peptidase I